MPTTGCIVVHSFSKSFLMTGWRLGWLVTPAGWRAGSAKLIEFNTSCAPVFVQRAGLAALRRGPSLRARAGRARARVPRHLGAAPRRRCPASSVAAPAGGLYAFFRASGERRLARLRQALVESAGLGLAPGSAFGAEGEGWLRWCFASREPGRLIEGVSGSARYLEL